MLSKGLAYENIALKYLEKNNLTLVEKNFHSRFGEIDLIMKDEDTLTFVEVRYRKNVSHGSASESVNLSKQKKSQPPLSLCNNLFNTKKNPNKVSSHKPTSLHHPFHLLERKLLLKDASVVFVVARSMKTVDLLTDLNLKTFLTTNYRSLKTQQSMTMKKILQREMTVSVLTSA